MVPKCLSALQSAAGGGNFNRLLKPTPQSSFFFWYRGLNLQSCARHAGAYTYTDELNPQPLPNLSDSVGLEMRLENLESDNAAYAKVS